MRVSRHDEGIGTRGALAARRRQGRFVDGLISQTLTVNHATYYITLVISVKEKMRVEWVPLALFSTEAFPDM